jgi:hypothetical protein
MLLVPALAFVTPAGAQIQTTCTQGIAGTVYCNTSPGLQIPPDWGSVANQGRPFDLGAAMEQAERVRQMRLQNELMQQQMELQREQMAQARDAEQRVKTSNNVSEFHRLMAAGQCAAAEELAMHELGTNEQDEARACAPGRK